MNKRIILTYLGLALICAGIFATPLHAHAQAEILAYQAYQSVQSTSLKTIGFDLLQQIAYGISYIIAIVGYIVFAIEAFFLQFLITINFSIVNSLSVQFGFSIVLAFANILFVAAVIIMAVATIIRYDTYGAKRLLWKIVIAAIGVNFSLILAGTAINFADQVTLYFLNHSIANPAGDTGTTARVFIDNLAGTFNPQKALIVGGVSTSTDATTIFSNAASQMGGMFAAIVGVGMTALMVVLLAIFFGVLAAAFLMRYIMLSLLLIIMPAVWLAWIFPFGKGLVNFWRDRFTKWTLFSPMAMFFLYLSMKSAAFMNSAHILGNKGITDLGAVNTAKQGGVSGFLYATFSAYSMQFVAQFLNFALVAGTLYGGLYFSSKLGIKAAGAGASAFESIGNSIKRRTVQRAKDTGAGAWDKLRTGGKDKFGNSRGQRWASTINSLATPNIKNKYVAAAVNGAMSVTGVKAGLSATARGMAAGSVAEKKDREARADRYKEDNKNFTGDEVKRQFDRNLSRSLHLQAEDEWGLFKNMIDKKQAGSLHEYAYAVNEKGETIRDKDGKPTTIDPVREKQLKDFMQRATTAGYADEVLKANPLLSQFAPPSQVEKRNADGTTMRDKDGKALKRNATKAEALFAAIKAMKAEDISDVVTKNLDVFGNANGNERPTREQIMAVRGLGGRVNKIEDPDALLRINNTLEWIYSNQSDPILISDFVDAPKDSKEFSTEGLGLKSARDFDAFKPVVKALDKNTALAPILLEVVGKNNNNGGGNNTPGNTQQAQAANNVAEASRQRRADRRASWERMRNKNRR